MDLTKLNYNFKLKPLLIGGKAKEYWNIRKSGDDIDFVISENDYLDLSLLYPNNLINLWGDLGVCIDEFELWKSIAQFSYDELVENSIEISDYKVISLEKLLFLTALGIKKEKYRNDLELIVKRVLDEKYKNIDVSKYKNQESMIKTFFSKILDI